MGFFTQSLHLPAPLAFLAIAAEFAGSLGLIVGLFGRVAAAGHRLHRRLGSHRDSQTAYLMDRQAWPACASSSSAALGPQLPALYLNESTGFDFAQTLSTGIIARQAAST